MPADSGEKTEAPTPRRLQDAREKGQVAKSNDLTAAVGLLAGLIVLDLYGKAIFQNFKYLMVRAFTMEDIPLSSMLAFQESWRLLIMKSMAILGPIFVVLFIIAVLANLFQVGFMLSTQPITPKLDKISPLQGFKRLFSLRTFVRFAMSMFKVGIIGLVAYLSIQSDLPELVGLTMLSFTEVISFSAEMVYMLGLRMAAILLILAIIDYAYQKYQMTQDLRMTKDEVKEEMKRMEGDPIMRQRRRKVAQELAMQRMSQAVPNADVVVTNPTHIAIALKYDHDTMPAPKVVAKGADFVAARIREIAMENGVPMVERKPLARALYKACDVGDYIPADLYKAVAEVLAYVFELAGKGYRKAVSS